MSLGIYNETYFRNHPQECSIPSVLYCVILVNKKTQKRESIKIGIAKGTSWKNVIKRAAGFKGYEIRIQKVVHGPLEEIYYLEQYLHELWNHKKFISEVKFGGYTELFIIDPEIIKSIPRTI